MRESFLLSLFGGGGAFRFGMILPCLLLLDIFRGPVEDLYGRDETVLLTANAVSEETRGLGMGGGEKPSRLNFGESVSDLFSKLILDSVSHVLFSSTTAYGLTTPTLRVSWKSSKSAGGSECRTLSLDLTGLPVPAKIERECSMKPHRCLSVYAYKILADNNRTATVLYSMK